MNYVIQFVFVYLFLSFSNFVYSDILKKKISINFSDLKFRDALIKLSDVGNFNFFFHDSIVPNIIIDKSFANETISDILDEILFNCQLDYQLIGDNTIVYKKKNNIVKEITDLEMTIINSSQPVDNLIMAKPKYKNKPNYPQLATQLNLHGQVVINSIISKEGKVIKAIVERSSGYKILDTNAIHFIKKMEFYPALFNDKPIIGTYKIEIKYILEK